MIWCLLVQYVSSFLGEKQIESITTRIEELQRQRDQEQGGKLEQLEKELKEKEKDTIKVESNLKNVKDSKKQEEKKKQQIIKVHIYLTGCSHNAIF